MINVLEAAAVRTQQAAARAWTDLMHGSADERTQERLQENYDRAAEAQDAAYDAWKAAQ